MKKILKKRGYKAGVKKREENKGEDGDGLIFALGEVNRDLKHFIKCFVHYYEMTDLDSEFSQIGKQLHKLFLEGVLTDNGGIILNFLKNMSDGLFFAEDGGKTLFDILTKILSLSAPTQGVKHMINAEMDSIFGFDEFAVTEEEMSIDHIQIKVAEAGIIELIVKAMKPGGNNPSLQYSAACLASHLLVYSQPDIVRIEFERVLKNREISGPFFSYIREVLA